MLVVECIPCIAVTIHIIIWFSHHRFSILSPAGDLHLLLNVFLALLLLYIIIWFSSHRFSILSPAEDLCWLLLHMKQRK